METPSNYPGQDIFEDPKVGDWVQIRIPGDSFVSKFTIIEADDENVVCDVVEEHPNGQIVNKGRLEIGDRTADAQGAVHARNGREGWRNIGITFGRDDNKVTGSSR